MVVASMERRIYHLEGCCCGKRYYPDTRYFHLYHGNYKPKSAEIQPYRRKDCHFQKQDGGSTSS